MTALRMAAVLFYFFGVFAVIVGKSDIQIIVAVLCFGFATMILGLAAILQQLIRGSVTVETNPAAPVDMSHWSDRDRAAHEAARRPASTTQEDHALDQIQAAARARRELRAEISGR